MPNMYDQNQYLYNPTNKDKLGLGIGSLISAALASTGGNNTREALIRAAAGGLAGYGTGWKGMQDQYGEVFRRAMDDRQLQNQEQSMAIRNALDMENQGLRREQFEANKPLIEARTERLKTPLMAKPVDYNKIRDERTLRRLNIRQKQKDLAGGEKTTQQLLEEAMNEGDVSLQKGLTATNPKTGERIISYDGGVTWKPRQ